MECDEPTSCAITLCSPESSQSTVIMMPSSDSSSRFPSLCDYKNQRSNSAMESGMLTYKMTAQPRGLALIINVKSFDNNVLEERKGSGKDVENLEELFRHLKFMIKIIENPTRKEFMVNLRTFANDPQHAKGDMAIIAILSHGTNGMVITHEGAKVDTEWIYSQFNNQKCPLLLGKPKFFIIQACRGEETDTVLSKHNFSDFSPVARKRRPPTSNDTDIQQVAKLSEDLSRARPTWEDMAIAYSTIPGYVSIRDHETGTWFIQSLCQTFFRHAHENNLIDLLMKTSEVLSRYSNEKNEKQTCNIELRHMYKRLYFNSDISVSSLMPQKYFARSLSTPPASPASQVINDYS